MQKYTALEKFSLIDPILKDDLTTTQVEVTFGIPARTLRCWKKQFLTAGIRGLERKKRNDKGKHRLIREELIQLIQALALQRPPLSIKAIQRKVAIIAQRQSSQPPAYGTIYGVVKRLSPALLTLAHEGGKLYSQKFELIYRRECCRPNEIWQADHTQLDIYILDAKGKERRPWLTIVMDDYSRAISGYYLCLDAPCALHTALALRQAIWRKKEPLWQICGVPLVLYTDHGSDFMSWHIEQVCINLKIRMVNSAVGRPQGRGKIERFFDTINKCVLMNLPGYSPKGKATTKPSLDLTALQDLLEKFIIAKYHYQRHRTTGEPPVERWAKGFLPQLPASLEALDSLLLFVDKPRKVQRDGIQFQGLRYIAATLAGFVGEAVTIRYDPRDLAEIRVYYQDRFLCRAICQDIAPMQVSLKEIQKARWRIKKELYQQVKKASQLIRNLELVRLSRQSLETKAKPKAAMEEPITLKRYEND